MNNVGEEQVAVHIEVVEDVPINNDEEVSKKDKELQQYFN